MLLVHIITIRKSDLLILITDENMYLINFSSKLLTITSQNTVCQKSKRLYQNKHCFFTHTENSNNLDDATGLKVPCQKELV